MFNFWNTVQIKDRCGESNGAIGEIKTETDTIRTNTELGPISFTNSKTRWATQRGPSIRACVVGNCPVVNKAERKTVRLLPLEREQSTAVW